jgi:predicted lysophospholipase L1 biosynthesis ABC-type transport system permease subunit
MVEPVNPLERRVLDSLLNTLAIAIRERTREIGTLRAIGMQRGKVVWLLLLEAALLGLGARPPARSSARRCRRG